MAPNFILMWIDIESMRIKNDSIATVLLALLLATIAITLIFSSKKAKKQWRLPLPPGPRGIPILGYIPFLGNDPPKKILELSKKYKSDIVSIRLGKVFTVIFNEHGVIKEALSNAFAQNRCEDMYTAVPELGFQTSNGEEWEEQRRFSMHTAKELGLGRGPWEKILQEEVQTFLDEVASHKGKPFDVAIPLSISVGNNILSLLIGRRLRKGEEDSRIKLLIEYPIIVFTSLAPTFVTSLYPILRRILIALKVSFYVENSKTIHQFRDLLWEEIEKHKTSDIENEADFINLYRATMMKKMGGNTKHYFSERSLAGNMNIIFLGASDTTASSIEWLMYLMARHPDAQKMVQEELDEVLGADGVASYYERDRIPYTFATMMESQRVSSIVPLSTPRRIYADIEVGGYTIPKGSDIIGNLWAAHNDPKHWPEPHKFKPERFLTEMKTLKKPDGFSAFSFGRRRCPGEIIAWMEVLTYFTSILRKFDIIMPPGEETEWEIMKGLVTHLKMRPLIFRLRERIQKVDR